MNDVYAPALDALRQRLANEESAVVDTKKLINKLSQIAGLPEPYGDVREISTVSVASLRPDTFYGKKQFRAIREYLEMRKAANLGPAETREIYDALAKGGYQFDAADANNAMTGMRSLMRKNSAVFHRLPNGTWGLTAWYETIRPTKQLPSKQSDTIEEYPEEHDTADVDPPAVRSSPLHLDDLA